MVWDQADGAFGSAAVPRPAGSSFMPLRRTHRRPDPAPWSECGEQAGVGVTGRGTGWGSAQGGGQVLHCDIAKQDLTPRMVFSMLFALTLARVAAGWSRRGLMVGRSGAERADCPAVLAAGAHRTTHYAPCGRFVRTSAMRMLTKRAARAAPAAALLGAPQIAPTGSSLPRRWVIGVRCPGGRGGGQVLHCDIAMQDLTPRTRMTPRTRKPGARRRRPVHREVGFLFAIVAKQDLTPVLGGKIAHWLPSARGSHGPARNADQRRKRCDNLP